MSLQEWQSAAEQKQMDKEHFQLYIWATAVDIFVLFGMCKFANTQSISSIESIQTISNLSFYIITANIAYVCHFILGCHSQDFNKLIPGKDPTCNQLAVCIENWEAKTWLRRENPELSFDSYLTGFLAAWCLVKCCCHSPRLLKQHRS